VADPARRSALLPLTAVALFWAFAVFQAVAASTLNLFPDLFIYRLGSEIGLRGESPYDLPRVRAAAAARFPDPKADENSFINNCGYFLPPMAILVYAPFAALSWSAAKLAWAVACGVAGYGITKLPILLRRPGDPPPAGLIWLLVPFLLLLNPFTLQIVMVGQVTVVSLGCVALGQWAFERGRPVLGTLLWSVAFVKPHVALPLVPLAWYLGGWRRAAGLVAVVAALNLVGATLAGGSPLFLRDYLAFLPTGHKEVKFNQAGLNPQITSWNRLLFALTVDPKRDLSPDNGILIELTAVTTLAGYLVWFGLVVGRCAIAGKRPSAAWAAAAAVAGAVVCSQVLAYEMLMLAVAVPWVRDLFAGGRRAFGWAAVLLMVVQLFPFPDTTPIFYFYRPVGAMAFALLVFLGPIDPLGDAPAKRH
jgi:hypothetical protein